MAHTTLTHESHSSCSPSTPPESNAISASNGRTFFARFASWSARAKSFALAILCWPALPWIAVSTMALCLMLAVETTAIAQAATTSPLDPTHAPVEWGAALFSAVTEKSWGLVVALALVGVVGVAKRFRVDEEGNTTVPKWLQGWLAPALAVAGGIGNALLEGQSIAAAASHGLLIGLAAVGLHQTTVKPVAKRMQK